MSHVMGGAGTQVSASDWRLEIAEERRRSLRYWLWTIAMTTLAVVIVGGITRLTQSGLSIVEWAPIMGIVPPLSEAEWEAAFELYRQFPEYQVLRQGMSLDEFKFIFFWEYLHRMLARGIGVVFLVPFVYFLVRGYMNRPLVWRTLTLFALGGLQGLMGWLMVASGLVDRPSVSHYRLAAHLSLAFIIFGWALWLARDLRVDGSPSAVAAPLRRRMLLGLGVVGTLLGVQVVWGAFVAGLRAGFFANTFPLMGGHLVPPGMLSIDPTWLNLVANPLTVQWLHRLIGTALLVAALAFGLGVLRSQVDAVSRRFAAAFLGLVAGQYALGVATLLYVVPISLGVAHQGLALILVGVWLAWLHHTLQLRRAAV